jgi:hypothetical protein
MVALPLMQKNWHHPHRGVVTKKIELMTYGRVQFDGYSWRASLHERACQTALLVGQPVIIVSRWRSTLTVLPVRCMLWDELLKQSWAILDRPTLEIMRQYDGVL